MGDTRGAPSADTEDMTRRPSNIMSSRASHALAARKAARTAPAGPHVSHDALLNILDRECEKQGRKWYGGPEHETTGAVLREVETLNPETRKEARQLILDRLDRFPLKAQS